ncbi:MAG: M48 family metalloprotease [Proteobacteria bacterium]|nr:M48 family metalloprotease [Pseudomonadota bacterium]
MITGFLGFMLNAFSIIVLSAVAVIALVSLAFYCRSIDFHRLSAESRQIGLWILVCSPWLIGVLSSAIVMLLSSPSVSSFAGSQFVHWHHPTEFALDSWHGYFVSIMLGLALLMALRAYIRVVRSSNTIRTLSAMSRPGPDGVRILDTNTAAAFTAGIKNPDCYITSALLDQISGEEFAIIRLHEMAHIKCNDPVKKTLFYLLTTFFPAPLAISFNQTMATAMEQSADAAVVSEQHDKATIAKTLLKVRRLAVQEFTDQFRLPQICHYGLDNIDQRIRYLLSDNKGDEVPMLSVLAFIGLLAIFCALGADTIHHAVEISLHHS